MARDGKPVSRLYWDRNLEVCVPPAGPATSSRTAPPAARAEKHEPIDDRNQNSAACGGGAVLIQWVVEGLAFSRASGGQRCARRDRWLWSAG
jgi:hypothetical protein